ncbi:unnamed protein product [Microthlaspi erraticum]|uniref:Uncharacterized protein n=1 Tax=Microthlaspi erraticum TaxID=1685480 RepID=A0A6D2LA67_9BRAS|nr:unnamed protein product [Microthlaspi erraticum]
MVYTRVGVWIPQCPPKNWEARSWSGDGRRPSGHSTHWGFHLSGEVLVRVDRIQIPDPRTGLLKANSTVSSIELSFLCLDSIESGGRVGASGLRSLPPSLRVVSPFPWLERRGSVRLLGREPPWSGEKDLLLRNVELMGPSSSCLKNQKPSSPNF